MFTTARIRSDSRPSTTLRSAGLALALLLGASAASATPAGLVSLWKGEGNGLDSVGTNGATLEGGIGFAAGVVGQAFSLDGVNDAANAGNNLTLDLSGDNGTGDSFTVTGWVSLDTLGRDMAIVDKDRSASNNDGWRLLYQGGSGQFWFCMGAAPANGCTPTASTTVKSTTAVSANTFYHLAAVKNGQDISLFVNGALESTSTMSFFYDTGVSDLRIGNHFNTALGLVDHLDGLIDEVALYNRALSASEIVGLATPGVPEPATALLMAGGLLVAARRRRRDNARRA